MNPTDRLRDVLTRFTVRKGQHTETTSVPTPALTVDVPEFSIQYKDGKPEHIIIQPNWTASNGMQINTLTGVRAFRQLQVHYSELKDWRVTDNYALTTYKNIKGTINSLDEVIELVVAVQIVITDMLDDWLFHRDMMAAHKEQ